MAKRAKAILTEIFCPIQIFTKAKDEHMREAEELVSLSMIVAITNNEAKDPFRFAGSFIFLCRDDK